jgi:hypothetical protein
MHMHMRSCRFLVASSIFVRTLSQWITGQKPGYRRHRARRPTQKLGVRNGMWKALRPGMIIPASVVFLLKGRNFLFIFSFSHLPLFAGVVDRDLNSIEFGVFVASASVSEAGEQLHSYHWPKALAYARSRSFYCSLKIHLEKPDYFDFCKVKPIIKHLDVKAGAKCKCSSLMTLLIVMQTRGDCGIKQPR